MMTQRAQRAIWDHTSANTDSGFKPRPLTVTVCMLHPAPDAPLVLMQVSSGVNTRTWSQACETLAQIWAHAVQVMLGVILSLSECPNPMILPLVTLKEKEHGHLCLAPVGPDPPVILQLVPQRKHHNHHLSETYKCGVDHYYNQRWIW